MPRKRPTRGQRYVTAILAEFEPTATERILLDEVAATLDLLEHAERLTKPEARQQRMILSRLTAQLDIDRPPAAPASVGGKSIRGRRAAEIRWSRAHRDTA